MKKMDMLFMMFVGAADIFFNPTIILVVIEGTVLGIVFGALPGLTATMGVALLIPLTFTMDPVAAIGMMLGCYVGGMAGGAISASLLNIPGTPSAVVTCLDGYPMAKHGKGAQALGWAAFASGFGSLISWFLLVVRVRQK
jgi:putative tricarboxylic transport membrane protein